MGDVVGVVGHDEPDGLGDGDRDGLVVAVVGDGHGGEVVGADVTGVDGAVEGDVTGVVRGGVGGDVGGVDGRAVGFGCGLD